MAFSMHASVEPGAPPLSAALATFMQWEIGALCAAMFGVILWRMRDGSINTRGLLDDKTTGRPSAARLQLLVLTLGAGGYYLLQVLHDPTHFPPLPDELLFALGGSQALFLAAKNLPALRSAAALLLKP